MPILCHDMIHHNLRQPIVHVDPSEYRSSSHRVNGFVHQRMAFYKANDFIRKVSGRFYEWIIGFAWTLKEKERPRSCDEYCERNTWNLQVFLLIGKNILSILKSQGLYPAPHLPWKPEHFPRWLNRCVNLVNYFFTVKFWSLCSCFVFI